MTTPPDRSAPVFFVTVYPSATKRSQAVDVSTRVVSFTYTDDEKAANKVELELDNFDLSLFDDPNWRKGNFVEVAWGYAGNMAPPRAAVIQKITGFAVMKVEALAQSILMNKLPMSRLFENMKRSDVVKQIASMNGYPDNLQDIEDTEIVFESISQARMTDAQFLRHLAQKESFEFYVDFDGFHWHRRRLNTRPVRSFVYYIDPGAGDVLSIEVENDVTATPGAVTAKGRDPVNKTPINERADNSNTKRDGLGPVAEAVDQTTGTTAFLQGAAAEHVMLSNAKTSAEGKREAAGKLIAKHKTTVQLKMNAVGDPRVGAKQIIEIANISKRLSGRYYVKKATHKLTATDYQMELACRSDGTHGVGAAGPQNPKQDSSLNTKDPADPGALSPQENVNQKTGETSVSYTKKATSK